MSFGGAQAFYAKMRAEAEAKAKAGSSGAAAAPAAPAPAATPSQFVEPKVRTPKKGVVLVYGCTNYAEMGKKAGNASSTDIAPNLFGPHRLLAGFGATPITRVITSGMSAHVVAIGAGGSVVPVE